MVTAIRGAFSKCSRGWFRLLHYSVQRNHVHLLVEADGSIGLSRGLQGLAIRVAKTVNRVLRRRGSVWDGRYHVRALETPREVRSAFVYVLNNVRKHVPQMRGLDPCSSASWFTGWDVDVPADSDIAPVAAARTWLARIGWLRHGRIHVDETPKRKRP